MNGAGQQTFRQFDSETRHLLRNTCSRPPELPGLFAGWGSRAHVITSEARRAATAQKTPKPESWRLTSVLPAAASKGTAMPGWPSVASTSTRNTATTTPEAGKNKEANPTSPLPDRLPPPWDPALWPSLDRILYPWEAPESPIEYAVNHFLKKESPELYGRLVDFALRYSGVVPEGFDTSFLTNPVILDKENQQT